MPETSTDLQTWNRPALQRTELGPMMHDLSHRLYDIVEATAMDEIDRYVVPDTFKKLGNFTTTLGAIVEESIRSDIESRRQQTLRDYINVNRAGHSYLTTVAAGSVILEGVLSGIYTPAHLYRAIDVCESLGSNWYHTTPRAEEQKMEPQIFADRLVSPNFLRMLHELSYAPNGFLGASSSDHTKLIGSDLLKCFPLSKLIFELDESGVVTGFSQSFLDTKRVEVKKANNSVDRFKHTGGCPVRHADFKQLGENARGYLDSEPLYNEGTSAITRGAQLLGNVIRARLAL